MADQLQLRGGTTAEHATFTGALREVTVDTDKDTVVVHDNATAGGHPLAKENLSNVSAATAATKLDGQTVKFGLGAAATPSVTFNGDLNTGIYSPGADQVAISTGGSGRLFVDSSGNVGLGGAPKGWGGGAIGALFNGSGSITAFSDEVSYGNNVYFNGAWRYARNDTAQLLQLGSGDIPLIFYSAATGTADASISWSERFRVDASGRLGVGTNSPTERLHVDGNILAGAGAQIMTASGAAQYGSRTANSVLFLVNNSEVARLDASGRLGIGTSDVKGALGLQHGNTSPQGLTDIAIDALRINQGVGGSVAIRATQYDSVNQPAAGDTQFFNLFYNGSSYNWYERMRITAAGRVGIGTASVGATLHVNDSGGGQNGTIRFGGSTYYGQIQHDAGATGYNIYNSQDTGGHIFQRNGNEQMRLDASSRLLLGTSSASSGAPSGGALIQGSGSAAGPLTLQVDATPAAAGTDIGFVRFTNSAGGLGAQIKCVSDGSWTNGSNHRSRLEFSTTADGASSPTERMRITNIGDLTNKTSNIGSITGTGFTLGASGYFVVTRSADCPVFINRETNDGNLIEFRQDGVTEGNINVSGTTVALAGAHLSRWSQLPSGVERTEILRGSVLSNIDEMCEWGDEENEQLNRMKVSDVEGDKNVSGVFQAWDDDDDDDTYTNDFYCAMTGDFIIRVAEGVTVERGDLLMSAGDGTAKPQDDDIIRSKTIAKVTSTNVSCTYDDGSYCVPCVLMAC